jgi:purine-binding chemotaxis protein CheW
MSMAKLTTTKEMVRVLRCSVGDETYGLEMAWVRGLARADQVATQGGPDGLAGTLPFRNQDVPVFHLGQRLWGGAPPRTTTGHVILVEQTRQPFGLLVDRVSQAQQVPTDCVLPLPSLALDADRNCFEGLLKLGEQYLLLLSPNRLFPGALPDGGGEGLAARPRWVPSALEGLPQGHHVRRTERIVVFTLAEPLAGERPLSFARDLAQVLEIVELRDLIPVPRAPAFALGLVIWRNRAVPVVDLGSRLGLPPVVPDRRARLLIVRAAQLGELAGFLVRPAIRILRLPVPHQVCTRHLPLDQGLIRGAVETRNETLIIPDVDRLFPRGPKEVLRLERPSETRLQIPVAGT